MQNYHQPQTPITPKRINKQIKIINIAHIQNFHIPINF